MIQNLAGLFLPVYLESFLTSLPCLLCLSFFLTIQFLSLTLECLFLFMIPLALLGSAVAAIFFSKAFLKSFFCLPFTSMRALSESSESSPSSSESSYSLSESSSMSSSSSSELLSSSESPLPSLAWGMMT
jgi:hypothetical protein